MLSSPSLGYRRLLGRASARSEGRQQRASHRIASHRIASHRIASHCRHSKPQGLSARAWWVSSRGRGAQAQIWRGV
jgi:hypothetical protein